jgi:hypothetical protein
MRYICRLTYIEPVIQLSASSDESYSHTLLSAKERRGSSVCIATGYGLDGRGSFSGRETCFYLVRNGSGTHPASYQMVKGGCFLKGKASGT